MIRQTFPQKLAFVVLISTLFAGCLAKSEKPIDKVAPLPDLGYGENPNATQWYVDNDTGDDNNSGNEDNPLETIQAAQEKMAPGDTLILREGIYTVESDDDFDLKLNVSGAGPHQKTTYRAYYDTSINNPKPSDYERVIITGPIDSGETEHRPPGVEVEGDYIRVEGIWFGGAWFAGNNAPDSGEPSKGREFHVYGGGRLDSVREIENCTFFGFNGVRVGALEYSFFRGNRFVGNGTVNDLGDPPPLYFSGNHGPQWQATHAIVDKNIFIRGTGYPINGWHSWRNFIVTRNFVSKTWGGFVTDGPGSEAPGPYGPGKDHLVAHNIFWKVTERNSHNGATLISENLHFLNNILAGLYDNRYDDHYAGTGGISVVKSPDSPMYWKKLSNFLVVDNAFYNLILGLFDSKEDQDRMFILDEVDDWQTRQNLKNDEVNGYDPEFKENALKMDDSLLTDGSDIDSVVEAIDGYFAEDMDTERLENIRDDPDIEEKFSKLQSITVPESSPIYHQGQSWYQNTSVNIGPDTDMPATPTAFWQEFSERGFYHYDATGERFVTP